MVSKEELDQVLEDAKEVSVVLVYKKS